MPAHGTLGEDIGSVGCGFQRASDNLFGVAEAIDRCSVNPVDAQIERTMNRRNGFVVVLRTPALFPVAATHGPGAEADGCKFEIGVAERAERLRCGRNSRRHTTLLDEF